MDDYCENCKTEVEHEDGHCLECGEFMECLIDKAEYMRYLVEDR